jgi:thymidylate synthase (FAD)
MKNNPKVTLLSITNDLQGVMGRVWEVAKGKLPLEEIDASKADLAAILSADLPVSEYVNTVWCVEGMPRAFWDQFDRCRHAAFWEQSVRILDLRDFADEQEYWIPDAVAKQPEALARYNATMRQIQDGYNDLMKLGVPSEDARGLLPLHINVRGTCCINLRALKQLISNRVCFIAQGSYWLPVVHGMMQELSKHLSQRVMTSLANLPCHGKGRCPIEGNVVTRLTSEDPNPVCPIYLKRFAKDKPAAEAFTKQRHPDYEKTKQTYFELIRSLGMET